MKAESQKSIGIFDSGIGGLTVANAISKELPNEHLIYFGDTAHLPYGDKSSDAIRYYALTISRFLINHNCKMIVVACNSASSAAYHTLLDFFEGKVLFVNVVDPLINLVIEKGYSRVGVIATKATIRSNIYNDKIKALTQNTSVFSLACPLLAPMIEEGFHQGKVSKTIIESYLQNENFDDIDSLLLACTHYPLIKSEIKSCLNKNVEVLDATDVMAQSVKLMLKQHHLLCDERMEEDIFYVSDFTPSFEASSKMFFSKKIKLRSAQIR